MNESKKEILVERLKEFREKNNLKQKDMYEAMQCSQAAYSSYESIRSDKTPSIEMLLNLHEKYNVSIDWLLGTDNEKMNNKNNNLKTMGDIIECLFLIEKATGILIKPIEETQYRPSCDAPDPYDITLYGLCFGDFILCEGSLNDFMKEWSEIKEFCKGREIGTTMYELWKKDIIQKKKQENINLSFQDIPDGVEEEGLPFI